MSRPLVVSLSSATSTRTQPISGKRCAPPGGWWTKGSKRQGLEVLHGGSEKELVACTRKPSQPHAFKAVVNLQVGKAHLDAFALVARLEEGFCPHQPACHVAGIFMNITGNLSRRTIRTAQHLEGTHIALDQASRHTGHNDTLEDVTKHIALTEPVQPNRVRAGRRGRARGPGRSESWASRWCLRRASVA